MTLRTVEMDFEYMNYIQEPPRKPHELMSQACSNDRITIESWRKIWLDNIEYNHKTYGPFSSSHIGSLYEKHLMKPVIVAGSGPSLKVNIEHLKGNRDIPIISCLHNFAYFEDRDINVDLYVTLDAGDIVLQDLYEGGQHDLDWYSERTKDKTLCAFIGTSRKLLEKWQGKILWFNAPIPDPGIIDTVAKIEKFQCYVSNGGNVLGACLYIAKAFCAASTIAFIGADFSFDYKKKFHAWDNHYDINMGHTMRAVDVWGNKVLTWSSYWNFKNWFDFISLTVPGFWVNCAEGGCMGAYPDGNLITIKQMALKDFIDQFYIHEKIKQQALDPANGIDPEVGQIKLLF